VLDILLERVKANFPGRLGSSMDIPQQCSVAEKVWNLAAWNYFQEAFNYVTELPKDALGECAVLEACVCLLEVYCGPTSQANSLRGQVSGSDFLTRFNGRTGASHLLPTDSASNPHADHQYLDGGDSTLLPSLGYGTSARYRPRAELAITEAKNGSQPLFCLYNLCHIPNCEKWKFEDVERYVWEGSCKYPTIYGLIEKILNDKFCPLGFKLKLLERYFDAGGYCFCARQVYLSLREAEEPDRFLDPELDALAGACYQLCYDAVLHRNDICRKKLYAKRHFRPYRR
jgi:hypothetical protein